MMSLVPNEDVMGEDFVNKFLWPGMSVKLNSEFVSARLPFEPRQDLSESSDTSPSADWGELCWDIHCT